MFATLRIMFGVAWKVTLTAELFGGNSGLGYLINMARQDFDTTTIFVSIVHDACCSYTVPTAWCSRPCRTACPDSMRNSSAPRVTRADAPDLKARLLGEGLIVALLAGWWLMRARPAGIRTAGTVGGRTAPAGSVHQSGIPGVTPPSPRCVWSSRCLLAGLIGSALAFLSARRAGA